MRRSDTHTALVGAVAEAGYTYSSVMSCMRSELYAYMYLQGCIISLWHSIGFPYSHVKVTDLRRINESKDNYALEYYHT